MPEGKPPRSSRQGTWSEAVLTLFGVQRGTHRMVQAYDSDLGGIVKLSGPFEVEVLRSVSPNEDRNAQTIRCFDRKRLR